ncbi:MAG TPA: hypothetical protein GYA04_00955, partial [Acholeplasma sp.]|nr:hypothetical protein [Acholeplasma sp.]
MNRSILVKSVITILSVFILTLSLGFIRFEVDETIPQDVTPQPIFQNNVFDTTLTEPDVSVEEFISISDIYLIVDSYMNAETQNDSNEVKDARDLAMSNAILSIVGERRVSIETAEELYHFGNMQSFNYRYQASINRYPYKLTMETILSLDYVLLADIDYSTMRSRKFIPIGTNIDVEIGERVVHDLPFTGTFDGMGHIISNLYLADYSYITTILQFDGDETTNTDIPLFKHYSMFSYVGEDAVIKNLILYNPIYELLDAPNGLSKTSMFVGENHGTIYNIGVIDEKVTQLGVNNSGIRFNLQHSSSETFTAAGFVHTNYGTIQNSYFVAENILVSGSRFRFHTRPFAYIDEGTIEGVAYADIVHNTTNDITPMEGITAYTTLELKNGTKNNQAISINSVNIPDEPKWNFYYLDSYPSLISLEYDEDENEFLIKDEYDLVAFTKLINLLTPVYGKTFDLHTYRIVNHINMTNIKTLKTTQREFKGVLYGGNNDFSSETQINENKYIFNLDISVPFIQGSQYYLGLIGLSSGIIP